MVGVWSTPSPGRFTPRKDSVPIYGRRGGPQGRSGRVRKISPPPEFDTRTVQTVQGRYTDWTIPAPTVLPLHIIKSSVYICRFNSPSVLRSRVIMGTSYRRGQCSYEVGNTIYTYIYIMFHKYINQIGDIHTTLFLLFIHCYVFRL